MIFYKPPIIVTKILPFSQMTSFFALTPIMGLQGLSLTSIIWM